MSSHPLIDQLQQNPQQPAQHNGWSLEATQPKSGPIGIQTDALRLRRQSPSTQNAPELARKVAKRTNYLLEPLKVVESEKKKALLRSDEPNRSKGKPREYYEVWVTPEDLSVHRYQSEKGKRRQPRPINLTWEQAERLARDVEQVYDGSSDD